MHLIVIALFVAINILFFIFMFSKKRKFFKLLENELNEVQFKLQRAPENERASRTLRNLSKDAFSKSLSLKIIWKKYEQHLVVLDELAEFF